MINTIRVVKQTLPETWEDLVVATLNYGHTVPSEYNQNTREVISLAEVLFPLKEPMLHKHSMPAGVADLIEYIYEVVEGIKDNLIGTSDTAWKYTYSDRLFNYPYLDEELSLGFGQNQISEIVDKLSESTITRRAQAITWIPNKDLYSDSPPCLQRLFFRLVNNGANDTLQLNMHSHWRSRDLAGAWFMNAFALVQLQQLVANRIGNQINQPVEVGSYIDICDSLHIYDKDMNRMIDCATKFTCTKKQDLYWSTVEEPIISIIEETIEQLQKKYDIQHILI